MMKLDNFVGMMTGHFDNKDQFNKMQAEGKTYPYAEHVNTICNDKINNLPEDFKGKFVVEESYCERKQRTANKWRTLISCLMAAFEKLLF